MTAAFFRVVALFGFAAFLAAVLLPDMAFDRFAAAARFLPAVFAAERALDFARDIVDALRPAAVFTADFFARAFRVAAFLAAIVLPALFLAAALLPALFFAATFPAAALLPLAVRGAVARLPRFAGLLVVFRPLRLDGSGTLATVEGLLAAASLAGLASDPTAAAAAAAFARAAALDLPGGRSTAAFAPADSVAGAPPADATFFARAARCARRRISDSSSCRSKAAIGSSLIRLSRIRPERGWSACVTDRVSGAAVSSEGRWTSPALGRGSFVGAGAGLCAVKSFERAKGGDACGLAPPNSRSAAALAASIVGSELC